MVSNPRRLVSLSKLKADRCSRELRRFLAVQLNECIERLIGTHSNCRSERLPRDADDHIAELQARGGSETHRDRQLYGARAPRSISRRHAQAILTGSELR